MKMENQIEKSYAELVWDQIKYLVCTSGQVNTSLWKCIFGNVPYKTPYDNHFFDCNLVLLTAYTGHAPLLRRNSSHGFAGSAFSRIKIGRLDISALDENNSVKYWAQENYDETDFRPFTQGRLEEEAESYARDIVVHSNKVAVVRSAKRGFRKLDELDVYTPTAVKGEVAVRKIPLHPLTVGVCKMFGDIVIADEE